MMPATTMASSSATVKRRRTMPSAACAVRSNVLLRKSIIALPLYSNCAVPRSLSGL